MNDVNYIFSSLHVRYGLVYVPNVMLFHNAKPIARFNETVMNLDQFVKFINKFTGKYFTSVLNFLQFALFNTLVLEYKLKLLILLL